MKRRQKSQVLVSVLILMTIVLVLSTALLFHSRSVRQISLLQSDADRAYSLAKTGIGIARYLNAGASGGGSCGGGGGIQRDETYILSPEEQITINMIPTLITSTGKVMSGTAVKNARVLTEAVAGGGGGGTWAKVYTLSAEEYLTSIRKTQDGGYLLEGQTGINGANAEDLLLVKINACGVIQWAKTYGGNNREVCNDEPTLNTPGSNTILEVSGKGPYDGYYMAKSTNSFGSGQYDFILFKINKNDGNIIWVKTYGGASTSEYLHDIQDDGTGFVLAGRTTMSSEGAIIVVKTDYDGTMGTKYYMYNTAKDESVESILPYVESSTSYWLLGGWIKTTVSGKTFPDFALVKINASTGAISAQKRYSCGTGQRDERIFAVKRSIDPATSNPDGFVVAGEVYAYSNYKFRGFIAQMSTDLAAINWYNYHEGAGGKNHMYRDLYQDGSGNNYVVGQRDGEGLWLKTNHQGAFQLMKQYGDKSASTIDLFYALEKTDSGFIMGGYAGTGSLGGTSSADYFVVSTDTSGDISGCTSIIGNDQSLSSETCATAPVDAGLTSLSGTILEKPIDKATVTVKTHPTDFTLGTKDPCS